VEAGIRNHKIWGGIGRGRTRSGDLLEIVARSIGACESLEPQSVALDQLASGAARQGCAAVDGGRRSVEPPPTAAGADRDAEAEDRRRERRTERQG
jgi:hypothetical protein